MHSEKENMKEPVFDHFGILAPLYERFIRLPESEILRGLLEPLATGMLLDVGGGTGRATKQLTSEYIKAVLLDASHGMLSQSISHTQLLPVQGGAERMPFADGAFDRIIAVDSFHHFRNRDLASKEMMRLLAPSGRLVIEEPDIRRLVVKFIALGETLLLMRSHFQPPERICMYFDHPGFNVRVYENASPNFWIIVDKL
jgi:SAM-dependent methyltransferase